MQDKNRYGYSPYLKAYTEDAPFYALIELAYLVEDKKTKEWFPKRSTWARYAEDSVESGNGDLIKNSLIKRELGCLYGEELWFTSFKGKKTIDEERVVENYHNFKFKFEPTDKNTANKEKKFGFSIETSRRKIILTVRRSGKSNTFYYDIARSENHENYRNAVKENLEDSLAIGPLLVLPHVLEWLTPAGYFTF